MKQDVQHNIQAKANLIWSIADCLRDVYKPHEYGKVILPLTVIKRFNDCLMPTKSAVLEKDRELKEKNVTVKAMRDRQFERVTGYKFYNLSPFSFNNLLDDADNLESNFKNFLGGFSDNIQDVIENFEFNIHIDRMVKSGVLYEVLKEFNTEKAYFGPEQISAVDMGYVFEELVRKFSESYNEAAGAHFTSRDIIYLMTDILIEEERDLLLEEGVVKTVYDMTMGTSQMLACMEERLKEIDSDAEVNSFGQEINAETFAIAKSDMLIKGGNPENMRHGNTLSDDKFSDYTFDYIISNPPFGVKWSVEQAAVEQEHKKGMLGRFGVGLPSIDDGQMLFTLNGLSKLKDDGRMAIIHNGSPLFGGDAGSGQSEIRKYIIENDYLEAIIQLPTDSFYNTGISTYVWVITKKKSAAREGRVQLIDASKAFEKRRKAIGNKRNDITDSARELILEAYRAYTTNGVFVNGDLMVKTKWFNNSDFGYLKITVDRPLRLKFQVTSERIELLKEEKGFINLATSKKKGEAGEKEIADGLAKQEAILTALSQANSTEYTNRPAFKDDLTSLFTANGVKLNATQWKFIFNVFGERSETADICYDGKGNPEPDSELRDTETVPLTETIEEYMVREVLPYASDAWVDETKTKIGYEIPFTRHFYEYVAPRPSRDILTEIMASEEKMMVVLKELLGHE